MTKEQLLQIQQDFKELNLSLDALCLQKVKDAGHSWIEFSDKFRAFEKRVLALAATPIGEAPQALHPTSAKLITDFFQSLTDKMIANQEKYGWQDEWATQDWEEECRAHMMRHIQKGDPRDVAIYAAFMWARGWSTATEAPQADNFTVQVQQGCKFEFDEWENDRLRAEVERLKGERDSLRDALEEIADHVTGEADDGILMQRIANKALKPKPQSNG